MKYTGALRQHALWEKNSPSPNAAPLDHSILPFYRVYLSARLYPHHDFSQLKGKLLQFSAFSKCQVEVCCDEHKVNLLSEKLQAASEEMAIVSRSEKCANLRISGLDDYHLLQDLTVQASEQSSSLAVRLESGYLVLHPYRLTSRGWLSGFGM